MAMNFVKREQLGFEDAEEFDSQSDDDILMDNPDELSGGMLTLGTAAGDEIDRELQKKRRESPRRASDCSSESEVSKKRVITRKNLLNMLQLCTKNLIEYAVESVHVVDESNETLQHFFIIMENIFQHGLKRQGYIMRLLKSEEWTDNFAPKDFWGFVENLGKIDDRSLGVFENIRNMPNLHTNQGRCRAWLRLSFMQRTLSESFKILQSQKKLLEDWYEDFAVMRCEEGVVVAGLLVGLDTIDCNVCLKGEALDKQQDVIDMSVYMSENLKFRSLYKEKGKELVERKSSDPLTTINSMRDQKAYLEELNRKLNVKLAEAESRTSLAKKELEQLKEIYKVAISANADLKHVMEDYRKERSQEKSVYERHVKGLKEDLERERELTLARANEHRDLVLAMKKQHETEMLLRQDLERELQNTKTVVKIKTEDLEGFQKDLETKDKIISDLKNDLERVKQANLNLIVNGASSSESTTNTEAPVEGERDRAVVNLESRLRLAEAKVLEMERKEEDILNEMGLIRGQLKRASIGKAEAEKKYKNEQELRAFAERDLESALKKINELQKQLEALSKVESESKRVLTRNKLLEEKLESQKQAMLNMGDNASSSSSTTSIGRLAEKGPKSSNESDANKCGICNEQFSLEKRKVGIIS
eukprot:Nk52_evm34s914 gene=Nk52_evmTU34s914